MHDTNAKKKRQIKNSRNKNGKSRKKNRNRINGGGGSGERSSRSLFDIFSGMLEPITTPLKNFFNGLRDD